MTTTYLSHAARERLDRAQADLDRHRVSALDGNCLACHQPEPCPARRAADMTFGRYGRLPRRRPGLTSTAGTASAGFLWFRGSEVR